MFQILLQTAQELKRKDINVFKNTKAPCISIRKLGVNFFYFQTDRTILGENE